MKELCVLEGCRVIQDDFRDPFGKVHFTADADIDADGANGQSDPKLAAYRPDNSGTEHLANAGYPKFPQYYRHILVCDLRDRPIVQKASDPAPGAFICMTAYEREGMARTNPRKYVDAATVPYVVVSPVIRQLARGVVMGCRALITNKRTGKIVNAVVADIGPRKKIGELSIAAAKAIGVPSNPRTGGEEDRVILYELFPGVPGVVNGETFRLVPA